MPGTSYGQKSYLLKKKNKADKTAESTDNGAFWDKNNIQTKLELLMDIPPNIHDGNLQIQRKKLTGQNKVSH